MRKTISLAAAATLLLATAASAQQQPAPQPGEPPASPAPAAPGAQPQAPAIQTVNVVDIEELPKETQTKVNEVIAKRGEDGLHRVRHTQRIDGFDRLEPAVPLDEDAVLDEHPQHLLEEERIAAGGAADRLGCLRIERPGQVLEQCAHVLARQRRELDGRTGPGGP